MGVWRPFSGVVETPGISYLHEREHKRELRRDQAKESTAIAESTYLDQERGLVFNLKSAFVQTLQAKAVLENAKENLSTGTGSSRSTARVSEPAIWLRWIWTAWSCSACSLNPTSKPRW
jgi:hypothetical protein